MWSLIVSAVFITLNFFFPIDMDECKDPGKNPCEEGTCENVIGDYKCRCPVGKYGDGKTGCKGVGIITIIAGN
jgi:hypothetical protein